MLRIASTTVQWWAIARIDDYGWKKSNLKAQPPEQNLSRF
jgi:hypothetical protein